MLLPPTDRVVRSANLVLDLRSGIPVSEEPRDAVPRVGILDGTRGDGHRRAITSGLHHLDGGCGEVDPWFPEGICEQVDGVSQSFSDDVTRSLQFVLRFRRSHVREVPVAVRVRSNFHPGTAKVVDLPPAQRDDVIEAASPEPCEASKYYRIHLEKPDGDEERRRKVEIQEDGKGMRMVVFV